METINKSISIIREIELSKVLDHPLEGDALVIQTFFDELFNGLEIDTLDGYPNSIFFVKNGHEVYMEQDYKNEKLYCSYDKVWSFFESKINLNYQEISDLIKYMVEQQLKKKVFTAQKCEPSFLLWVEQQLKKKVFTAFLEQWFLSPLVEQQLKSKVFTAQYLAFHTLHRVEQQFKNKVFTPNFLDKEIADVVEQQFKNKVSVSYGNTEKVEENNLI